MTLLTRCLRLAAKLYPKSWRDRYSREFDSHLAAIEPVPSDIIDILQGAVTMHLRILAKHLKLVGALGIAGVIVALAVAYLSPRTYVSSAVVRAPGGRNDTPWISFAWPAVISRASLSQITQTPTLDLYKPERRRQPLEDVIEKMQKQIKIHRTPDGTMLISFSYPDRYKSWAVVEALTAKFASQPGPPLRVLTRANFPETPMTPDLRSFLSWGLGLGLIAGTIIAFLRWRPKWTLKVLTAGLIACVAAAALSLLLPSRYVSTAVVRVARDDDGVQHYMTTGQLSNWLDKKQHDIASNESLSEIMQRVSISLYPKERETLPLETVIAKMRQDLTIDVQSDSTVMIAFAYRDRFKAQQVVSALITKLVDSSFQTNIMDLMAARPVPPRDAYERCVGKTGEAYINCVGKLQQTSDSHAGPHPRKAIEDIDLVDPASLAESPVAPNRSTIAILGLIAGLLFGAWLLRDRSQPPDLTPAAAH